MARIDIRSNGGGGSVAEGVLQLENGVAMDSTLRSVTDQNNTTSPLKLSTTAVQVNSPLRITTSDASGFYLDAEDSATNNRFSIKRDPSSQEVTLDFASNPAGSTTLVGAIRTYQDGVNLSNAMSFIEDGSVGIGTNTPVGILHIKKTAANTRLAIDGDAGFNRLISYRTSAVQRFGLYVNNTAESGANVGSDFAIRAYSDAGTLLTTPVFIKRSTGNVGINTLTGTAKLQVVGSGSTSATTSFLVQNSSGTAALTVKDDLTSTFNSNVIVTGGSQVSSSLSYTSNFGLSITGGIGVNSDVTITDRTGTLAIQVVNGGNNILKTSKIDTITIGGGTGISASIRTSGVYGLVIQGFSGSIYDTTITESTGNDGLFIPSNGSVKIGRYDSTYNNSAILEAVSTTKGFLPPRMTNAQRTAIGTPAIGLMVYCTDAVEGLYVYKSTGWTFVI
jgi:hypothetical protein